MRLVIDAEPWLYTAAASAEFEVQWDHDLWTYWCDHGRAMESFNVQLEGTIRALPAKWRDRMDGEPLLALGGRGNFRLVGQGPLPQAACSVFRGRTSRHPPPYAGLTSPGPMAYLANTARLDLGLVGPSDIPLPLVEAAVTAAGPAAPAYVAPEITLAPVDPAKAPAGTGGAQQAAGTGGTGPAPAPMPEASGRPGKAPKNAPASSGATQGV